MSRVGIVGGGWAGLAAALQAQADGHDVLLLEAARTWGGRARRLELPWPTDLPHPEQRPRLVLDNGQHILIGGYTATLGLMQGLGLRPDDLLRAVPLNLRFADGSGLATPAWAARWPAPWAVLAATAVAGGWGCRDKLGFVAHMARWRRQGFACAADTSVAALCRDLPPRVRDDLIDPLCVAALNTPMARASARVFLRVLRDALLGPAHAPWRASDLLLPRVDLGELLPRAAVQRLAAGGASLQTGRRVQALHALPGGWRLVLDDTAHAVDQVVLACPAAEAARLVASAQWPGAGAAEWCDRAQGLAHESIATVYLYSPSAVAALQATPVLALRGGPAQFVFDRSALGAAPTWSGGGSLLAAVASACSGDRQAIEDAVREQLAGALAQPGLRPLQTVVEKRATFACTPDLRRPGMAIAPGLWAAGDHVDGPYPATLEGAVRSGLQAAQALTRPGRPGG
ncbi:hydroxysqualene dehydroxylase HpnE [Aquabacterium sp. A08]|uniref:hydroxysqualene dehydroxylase HpnE n=1 Tax=Aquabacterium sp. A08 TaxID=2718532 RepID=UPI00141E9912|nr:NAD(P)-binding protein [Aquabacterium sp. A08]